MSQKDTIPTFRRRLEYVRWLRARGRTAESDRELAAATGVGYAWLNKWKSRDDAPDSHEQRQKVMEGFAPYGDWLLNGGEPPHKALWAYWNLETAGEDARTPAAARPRPKRR